MKLPAAMFLIMVSVWLPVGANSAQYFCGRTLSNALASLCRTHNIGKRSSMDVVVNYIQETGWPWLPPQAKAFKKKRNVSGVATECCEKPCTFDELLAYC
ncbi:insulin-related peptide 4-like [Ostrinia nubilalis]|uniref:insulin-related peptide 4-like n=1 Tax=Ostrinia nubilalis TaxID=29057 RepID=UPI0030823CF5